MNRLSLTNHGLLRPIRAEVIRQVPYLIIIIEPAMARQAAWCGDGIPFSFEITQHPPYLVRNDGRGGVRGFIDKSEQPELSGDHLPA